MNKPKFAQVKPRVVRCAIYTRKSTEEGLQQEFNSLDSQRESAEAYIKSQEHEGWVCIPDQYDDGGFTGGNMERPALKRLLADIQAGRVDAVIVYKVDRLSRSLLDFARMLEIFERHHVAFVSVTQQFNTANSMGRLMLNVLLSFAQFERELISERTRDKMAATRRKGKYCGGVPILGYDVVDTKLVVNPEEAARVVDIFKLYLMEKSIIATIRELDWRNWSNKSWTTKKGTVYGGGRFNKHSLTRLLSNVTYAGKLRYKHEVHPGQHEAIVPAELFDEVQKNLGAGGVGGSRVRNTSGALLKGLLFCSACDCAMTPAYSSKGNRRYRYYVCLNAQKRGWANCPSKSVSANQIEKFVVERIKGIGRDPELLTETIGQANKLAVQQIGELKCEQAETEQELERLNSELAKLSVRSGDPSVTARLADLNDRILAAERRLTEIREQMVVLERTTIDPDQAATALEQFEPVWEALTPTERARVFQLLIERIEFDARSSKIAITFQPTGIRMLGEQFNWQQQSENAK